MTVKLSSLRVTAEMDASAYTAGAAQKLAADKSIVASSEAVGRALASQDANLKTASAATVGLSKAYEPGYASGAKFEAAIRSINFQLEQSSKSGMTAERAISTYRGALEKTGQISDVSAIQSAGMSSLAAAVSKANAELRAHAEVKAEIARRDAIGGALGRNINERMGIGQGQGASARESASVFEAADLKEQAKQLDAMKQSAASLTQSLLPMQAERKRSEANFTEIAKLEKARVISMDTANQMRSSEVLRTEQSRKSIEGMYIAQGKYTNGVGLARNEVVNLSRQLQDVAVTLQMGQPLSTILLQQGTQIADIFTSSRATMGGFFAQAARGIAGFATSVAGIATGLLAVGVGAVYVGTKFADGQREVERYLSGIGRVSGATVADVNRVAEALSRQQRISVSAAREVAAIGAGSGVRSGNLGQFTSVARDYAAQTGQGLDDAAKEMAKAIADPTKGAEALNEKLGFLDARTKEYIRTLQQQGNTTEAQKALLDAMSGSVQGSANRVSILTKAWEGLKNGASNAINAIGEAVAGELTLEERLAQAIERRLRSSQGLSAGTASGRARSERALSDIENIQEQIRLEGRLSIARTESARANQLSLKNEGIIKGVNSDLENIREYKTVLDSLERGRGGPNANDAQYARTLEAAKYRSSTALTDQEKIAREADLAVKSAQARTVAEQEVVTRLREQLSLAGQLVAPEIERLRIAKELVITQAQNNREARDLSRAANDNAARSGLRANDAARLQREQEDRDRRVKLQTGLQDPSAPQGNFVPYGPFRVTAAGGAAATSGAMAGLDPDFANKVKALIAAVGDSGATMTSGKRTFEKQQELYDKYGPRKAAVPGTSRHEIGEAADYTFSNQASRAKAMELAQGQGLRASSSNGGAVHFESLTRGANTNTTATSNNTKELLDNTKARNEQAARNTEWSVPIRQLEDDFKRQSAALDASIATYGKSTFEIEKARRSQELLAQFQEKSAIPLTDQQRAKLDELASAMARVAEKAATVKLNQDISFERDQIFRSDGEKTIASRLRGAGVGMESEIADQLRYNAALEQSVTIASDFGTAMGQGFMKGEKGIKIFNSQVEKLANQFISMASNYLVRSLFGSLFGGGGGSGGGGIFSALLGGGSGPILPSSGPILPSGASFIQGVLPSGFAVGATTGTGGSYANGAAFSRGNVIPFAQGGITTGPSFFPMSGGRTGLMGEAGEEGILPLKRTKNGALGVHASGGGGGSSNSVTINMPVDASNADPGSAAKIIAYVDKRAAQATAEALAQMQRMNDQGRRYA